MKRRRYLATVSATVSGLALAGCSADDGSSGDGGGDSTPTASPTPTPTPTPTATPTQSWQEKYPNAYYFDSETKILINGDLSAELDSIGNLYIRGTATNKSENDYSYVQLSWAVFDSSGRKIADGLANTNGLPAGQSWRFEALAPGAENVDSYELQDITAY